MYGNDGLQFACTDKCPDSAPFPVTDETDADGDGTRYLCSRKDRAAAYVCKTSPSRRYLSFIYDALL